ncbi:MAG: peptidoglycan DD-metalloendopeptidase family protein [Flavobacteriales bacterium]
MSAKTIPQLLEEHSPSFHPLFDIPLNARDIIAPDLSGRSPEWERIDLSDTEALSTLIRQKLGNGRAAVGGYGEHRVFYERSPLFQGEEARSIHLGVDVWIEDGSPVYTPLYGKVHSYANNDTFGDYGPTIVLEHELEGHLFHTLYGHLDPGSLSRVKERKAFSEGEQLGSVGDETVNGNWPPHLHFQVIIDMEGMKGDYPGVARPSEKAAYLGNCPDPAPFLK